MKYAVISSSQLAAHRRWDARFHLAMIEHEKKVSWLAGSHGRSFLLSAASIIGFNKEAWETVRRGHQRWDEKALSGYTEEAIALYICIAMKDAVSVIEQRAQDSTTTLKRLRELQQDLLTAEFPFTKEM